MVLIIDILNIGIIYFIIIYLSLSKMEYSNEKQKLLSKKRNSDNKFNKVDQILFKRQKNSEISLLSNKNNKLTINSMKIINLNTDCLIEIFKYLNLNDLLSVGYSNTNLKDAAGMVMKQFYGDEVTISIGRENRIFLFFGGFELTATQSEFFLKFLVILLIRQNFVVVMITNPI